MRAVLQVAFGVCLTLSGCGGESSHSPKPGPAEQPGAPDVQGTPPSAPKRPAKLTPAEVDAYQKELARLFGQGRPAVVRPGPPGTKMKSIVLPGATHVSVASVGSDGKLHTECADTEEGALGLVREPRPALEVQ